jgi:selenocysteine lyase/cysteine desulfurase
MSFLLLHGNGRLEDMNMDRRGFFSSSAMAAAGTLPSYAAFAAAMSQPAAPLPDAALYDKDEEAYWTQLRKQFLIPSDEVYLNNGTVGSSPWPVLKAVFDAYTDAERLALKAGDEVLMTDQEHPGGEHPWNLRAKRYGIVVKKVVLPKPVPNAATVLNLFNDAITSRTRVIFVSHVTTVTGVVLPAKELCALARSKGLLSAVDGAHVTGMMSLNVREIGCDMYASSPHKWLQAPKGSGFLYVRDEVIDRLWNTIATEGWDETELRAERFQRIGTSNVPALAGMRAAVRLANQIGMQRIEKRHRMLADVVLAEMVKRGAESWTSPDAALRCAIATVNVPGIVRMDLETWLWKHKKIRIRGGDPSRLRLSTPYYVLRKDVDRYLAAFDEYRATQRVT